jgi:AhpD family alkylhydroperoxidase
MTMTENSTRVTLEQQTPSVYRAYVEVAKAVRRAAKDAGLDRTLVELINIRVSQINGCASCLDVHVRDALAAGERAQRLAVLPAWRDTTVFTDRERAALTLAESITGLPDARTQDADYADARAQLSEEELSVIAWIVITMNAFNRISIVSRHVVTPDAVQAAARDAAPAAGRST